MSDHSTGFCKDSPKILFKKSIKVSDSSMLSDEKESCFEDWLLLMKQKLSVNKDHFDFSQLCIAYMTS